MASTAWTETAARQTTLLTHGSSISDYLVLQKAVASYSLHPAAEKVPLVSCSFV